MSLYMAVTADKYELPVAVAESVKELSNMTGYTEALILSSISKRQIGNRRGIRFVRVEEEKKRVPAIKLVTYLAPEWKWTPKHFTD